MTPESFSRWAVSRAVEVVNLYIDREEKVTQSDLHTHLHGYGFPEEALDVAAFEALANDLRDTFRDPERSVRLAGINRLLDRAQPRPRLVEHDETGPHFHYDATGSPQDHITSGMLMAIALVVVDRGVERFGWCAEPACDHLFYDHSRNLSQRFCSRTCSTRVHVRAHRARKSRGPDPEPRP